MDLHHQSIEARIDWLFGHAKSHAENFGSPDTWLARKRYLAEHPTAIAVMKCMDGRINIPVATETPAGIIQPFRNLGGRFDLGWPHLGEVLSEYVMSVIRQGRRSLMVATYHYSKGDPYLGCAGFNYDTAAAREHTFAIRRQIEQVFGTGHQTVYPLVCGFETDEDALVLHGENGNILDVSMLTETGTLSARLQGLFPDMPEQMRADLMPLIEGNMRHVAEVRRANRHLDVEHREWVICLGRGFDWLHMHNQALIIGPYSPDLADPVRKAAGILQSNMSAGRIPDDGFLLLASVPYADIGVERARRTQVKIPLRLRSRRHHPRIPATGRKNAPQNSGAELGQPESGNAQRRFLIRNEIFLNGGRPSGRHVGLKPDRSPDRSWINQVGSIRSCFRALL